MVHAAGVDARQREGLAVVRIDEAGLARVEAFDDVETMLDATGDLDALAVDIPIGHEDPTGERGRPVRACEQAARERMGPAADERVLPYPPSTVFEIDHYHEAVDFSEDRGWPAPPKPIWYAHYRIEALTEAAADDERIVEMHPEVSFTVMHELHGGQGPLEHYGTGFSAVHERIELLRAHGVDPTRSFDGSEWLGPQEAVEIAAAAWTARRVATGEALTLPEDPPVDPRTRRPVAFWA